MAKIYIESKPVTIAGIDTGSMHSYLIYENDDGSREVIRGGPEADNPLAFGNIKVEVGTPWEQSEDYYEGTLPVDRHRAELNLNGKDPQGVWDEMKGHAAAVSDATLDYNAVNYPSNCNSVVSGTLMSAGYRFEENLPKGTTVDNYPGYQNYEVREEGPMDTWTKDGVLHDHSEDRETMPGIPVDQHSSIEESDMPTDGVIAEGDVLDSTLMAEGPALQV